jgi:uncharacterized coiled-coil protein SlyX
MLGRMATEAEKKEGEEMNTTDIKMCIENESLATVRDSAEEQLAALLARIAERDAAVHELNKVVAWQKMGIEQRDKRIAELEQRSNV